MSYVPGRQTVDNSEGLVVFLIGARINKWWLLPLIVPIFAMMPRMLRELSKNPELGLLGVQSLGLGGMVQYWKSLEHLQAYAADRRRLHQPTWIRYTKELLMNGAAGIWHETYVIPAGAYESLYGNMPRWGLGLFKPLVPVTGALNTAAGRLDQSQARAT